MLSLFRFNFRCTRFLLLIGISAEKCIETTMIMDFFYPNNIIVVSIEAMQLKIV